METLQWGLKPKEGILIRNLVRYILVVACIVFLLDHGAVYRVNYCYIQSKFQMLC